MVFVIQIFLGSKAALSPVCRVDIFKTQAGRLVVNEFEGLEAQINPNGDRSKIVCNTIKSYLKAYWVDVIRACIDKCRSKN